MDAKSVATAVRSCRFRWLASVGLSLWVAPSTSFYSIECIVGIRQKLLLYKMNFGAVKILIARLRAAFDITDHSILAISSLESHRVTCQCFYTILALFAALSVSYGRGLSY